MTQLNQSDRGGSKFFKKIFLPSPLEDCAQNKLDIVFNHSYCTPLEIKNH